jgi:DNA ligase 1
MTAKTFAKFLSKLEKTASRNKITEILAELFRKSTPEETDKICYLLLGKLAAPFEGIEFNIAEKMMVRIISQAFSVSEESVQKMFKKNGDLGTTAVYFRRKSKNLKAKRKTVGEVFDQLYEISREEGEGSVERKSRLLADLIKESSEEFLKYLARIPVGKLRLGFSNMTILDSLSWMEKGDKSLRPEIEAAYNVAADIGKIAKSFRSGGLKALKKTKAETGIPILVARADRLPSAEKIIEKLEKCAVEPKIDGFRMQIHIDKTKKEQKLKKNQESLFQTKEKPLIRLYSRSLENTTAMFPDVVSACLKWLENDNSFKSAILDCEAVGYDPKTNKLFSFQKTVQRKRKYGIDRIKKEIPLAVFVFDILLINGKSLLKTTFIERRHLLEKTLPKNDQVIRLNKQIITNDPKILQNEFERNIKNGLEGVVCKKLDSVYQAGSRNFNWVKFKKSMDSKLNDTIDCLVMGYYHGKGKRSNFGIGAFLVGIYDEKTKLFKTVAKIGTGLSDKQWVSLRKRCDKVKANKKPAEYKVDKNLFADVWCWPEITVEIKADEITKSPAHTAGLALRFPRLEKFRKLEIKDIASLKETERMYKSQ